jgi:electron transport complex protein RnfC
LFGKHSFKGGIHPPYNKNTTSALPIEPFAAPEKVVIPLSQHIGAAATPTVKKGDKVKIGQVIGEAAGFVSSPVHSSVSGTVLSVGAFPHQSGKNLPAVEIENDGSDETVEMVPLEKPFNEAAPGELIKKISASGIVGMGGASFPTHVKLSPPSNKPIDTVIINGAECEPCLTADHRLMLEKTRQILLGALIVKKILGVGRTIIAVEDNKPDAIEAVAVALKDSAFAPISLARVKTKYPQGGEKQLIEALTKRQVPSGGLPMDVRCVVHNVGTVYAIWNAVANGIPLYDRVTTVTGPAVHSPKNLWIRIGTPLRHVLDHCRTDMAGAAKVILGGPMMGLAQSDMNVPVMKSTSGILALDNTVPGYRRHECINCGRCGRACPVSLVPAILVRYVEKEYYEEAARWGVSDCTECGCCSYVCPAKINLVHFMKLGKYHLIHAKAEVKPAG